MPRDLILYDALFELLDDAQKEQLLSLLRSYGVKVHRLRRPLGLPADRLPRDCFRAEVSRDGRTGFRQICTHFQFRILTQNPIFARTEHSWGLGSEAEAGYEYSHLCIFGRWLRINSRFAWVS